MSDQNWWQASDGKWYPPETRPLALAEQPSDIPPLPSSAAGPFCSGCGVQLNQLSGFCSSCGQQIGIPKSIQEGSTGRGFAVAGLVCGIISLFVLPVVLGPLGVIFGSVAWSKGSKFGVAATIVSIPCMVFGMFFGMMVWSAV